MKGQILKLDKPRVIFVKYDLFPQVRDFTIDCYDERGYPGTNGTYWKPEAVIHNMEAEEAQPYVDALRGAIAEQRLRHKEVDDEIREQLYSKCYFLKATK